MRIVKFRAIGKDGKWHYGNLITNIFKGGWVHAIQYGNDADEEDITLKVVNVFKHETIGQWTGLNDKNGKDIYEGDIVTARMETNSPKIIGEVIFEDGAYLVEYNFPYTLKEFLFVFVSAEYEPIEVIGNIFENSDLLENKDV